VGGLQVAHAAPIGHSDRDHEQQTGCLHHGEEDRQPDGFPNARQEDDDRHRQKRERVRHDRRSGEVSQVTAEAERDRGHGEQVGG
jgi:hypothetical protein